MAKKAVKKHVSKANAKLKAGELERRAASKAILGNTDDFLFVTGLAGSKDDVLNATGPLASNVFPLSGAMGAACSIGLGLALAQPEKTVVVVTGEGELLMNVGTLATIGAMDPPNLRILCIDNERYGETGWHPSHTLRGVDLAKMAEGANIKSVRTVTKKSQFKEARELLRGANSTAFILLKVAATDPGKLPGPAERDASVWKTRFRDNLGIRS